MAGWPGQALCRLCAGAQMSLCTLTVPRAAPGWGWSFPCCSQHLPERGLGGRRGKRGENTPGQLRTVLLLSWGCSHPVSLPPSQPRALCHCQCQGLLQPGGSGISKPKHSSAALSLCVCIQLLPNPGFTPLPGQSCPLQEEIPPGTASAVSSCPCPSSPHIPGPSPGTGPSSSPGFHLSAMSYPCSAFPASHSPSSSRQPWQQPSPSSTL